MSVYLDVVCTDRRISSSQRRENTLRAIGEILPFVLAKYRSGRNAFPPQSERRQRQPRFEA